MASWAGIGVGGDVDLVFGKVTEVRVFAGGPDGFCPDGHYGLARFVRCAQSRSPTLASGTATWTLPALSHTYDDKPETFANSSCIF